MQRFEDADKINASFAKRHVAELAGVVTGHRQRVFQVDRGDTVDTQLQLGGHVVPPGAEVADVWINGEPR